MTWIFVALAFLAGAIIPTQTGINAQLGRFLANPLQASFVSFCVGTVALLVACAAFRMPFGALLRLREAPPWLWVGGVLGAVFVTATLFLAQRLPAAFLLGLLVAGQMSASLILDHNGWLGFPEKSATPMRLAGALLIVLGVTLIRKF